VREDVLCAGEVWGWVEGGEQTRGHHTRTATPTPAVQIQHLRSTQTDREVRVITDHGPSKEKPFRQMVTGYCVCIATSLFVRTRCLSCHTHQDSASTTELRSNVQTQELPKPLIDDEHQTDFVLLTSVLPMVSKWRCVYQITHPNIPPVSVGAVERAAESHRHSPRQGSAHT
jgi:hypothetical protein